MRYALIDNSTLTAIQRLLGKIPINNIAIIDSDILSLENYIQAILFYDTIVCIDDYKETHKKKRMEYFSDIKFISKDEFDYEYFLKKTNNITEDILIEIRSGKITDKTFKEYFDRLNMTFQFTWDMASSKYFLTQKMLLGNSTPFNSKFNLLYASLYKEKNEQYEVCGSIVKKSPELYDSKGRKILLDEKNNTLNSNEGDGLSGQLENFITSLNWMSQRTAFYVLLADYFKADLFLQPIRQDFLQSIIAKLYPSYQIGVFNKAINEINTLAKESLNNILLNCGNYAFSCDLPLFSTYFANKTRDSKKIIESVYFERENRSFVEARNRLRELNNYIENHNKAKFIKEINLLISDLRKNFESIQSKYGLGNQQGISLKFLLSCIPMIGNIELPESGRIKSLEFLKHTLPKKGLNAVYRNIIEDLSSVEKLGKYKDILVKNVVYGDSAYEYSLKIEEEKYIKCHSHWKKPM